MNSEPEAPKTCAPTRGEESVRIPRMADAQTRRMGTSLAVPKHATIRLEDVHEPIRNPAASRDRRRFELARPGSREGVRRSDPEGLQEREVPRRGQGVRLLRLQSGHERAEGRLHEERGRQEDAPQAPGTAAAGHARARAAGRPVSAGEPPAFSPDEYRRHLEEVKREILAAIPRQDPRSWRLLSVVLPVVLTSFFSLFVYRFQAGIADKVDRESKALQARLSLTQDYYRERLRIYQAIHQSVIGVKDKAQGAAGPPGGGGGGGRGGPPPPPRA